MTLNDTFWIQKTFDTSYVSTSVENSPYKDGDFSKVLLAPSDRVFDSPYSLRRDSFSLLTWSKNSLSSFMDFSVSVML